MYNSLFFKDLAERAIKTAAQALVAMFVAGVTILSVSWLDAFAVAGTAALVSVLTSIASSGVGRPGTPSLVAPDVPVEGRHRLD